MFISSQSHKHFIIYSDSKSALDSLESSSCSPTFISVLNLYNALVKKGYNILFCWIPGHAGIKGNEQADIAAKQASNPLNCTIPYSDLKNTIRNLIKDKWQINWNLQANNKLKQIKPTITPWPSIPCRKTDVLLTHLQIGHSRITLRHLLLGEAKSHTSWVLFSGLHARSDFIISECSNQSTSCITVVENVAVSGSQSLDFHDCNYVYNPLCDGTPIHCIPLPSAQKLK